MAQAQSNVETEERVSIVQARIGQTAHERFGDPKNFINRELSWLEFNRRVLEEAQDATQPLIERVKFLSIFSSNLDEFFEIRVAGIKQQIESETSDVGSDGLSPTETFNQIQRLAHELVATEYDLFNKELVPELDKNRVRIRQVSELGARRAAWARKYFREEVFPMLTPLAVDASHPFPDLLNKSHNLLVRAKTKRRGEPLLAIVQVPRVIPRLILMPRGQGEDEPWDYIYLASLIKQHIAELFPGLILDAVHAFRVTRNSDLYIDDEEAENLLRTIEQELRRSSKGDAVRLEVEADCPRDFIELLLEFYDLTEADVYKLNGPLSMTHLSPLLANDAFANLKDRPFQPGRDPALPPHADMFEVMRRQDVLLHHPYDSFEPIVDLVEEAARDPQVLAVKITLYRTSGDSPIVEALIDAATAGKQVTAIVELRARFDEAANIQWARRLEEAGAHVIYGVVGLKTHCKVLLIVRRDSNQIRRYVHLGTGNYHQRTARIYTDFGLLTSNPQLTEEVAIVFNTLTGLAAYPGLKKLMVAPFDMKQRLIAKIQRERDHARAGRPARIVAKLNSLVDQEIIETLYEASCAEVVIDLIVRSICCLRPKVPGVSEFIRVISIVGRFLEHSRIYYFENGGQPEVYLSSADWMPRNFLRRVEVAFPIETPLLRDHITNEVLPRFLDDRVKARALQPDGSYRRLKPEGLEHRSQAQWHFREVTRERAKRQGRTKPPPADKLIPITIAPEEPPRRS
ncbi:MAG TPA: polyphosphate kinase 1 [Chthoniobacterales bacterium]|jgi:polyphosphate kinase|nr:polyphosphate kinase 1 [Chthoniobacterales bacterium]